MQNLTYLLLRRAWWKLKNYPAQSVARLLAESQWWPRQKIEDFRDQKLRQLIQHCYENVPYYRQVMRERNLRPEDIRSAGDLKKLPILTKSDVRRNWKQLRAENIIDRHVSIVVTGGSTGEPLKIAKHIKANCWATMAYERGLSWGGLKPGTKHIVLMGGTLGGYKSSWLTTLSHKVSGRINLPAYDLAEHNVHEYANLIRRSEAQFLIGYPSSIYDLSRRILERGQELRFQAVFTSAERLYPEWTEVIRQATQCNVYQYYGCAECNSIAYQCKEGSSYHITEEHAIVEIQAHSDVVCLFGSGEGLLTNLDDYAMPLLRYKNGDYITLGDNQCSCGRSLKLISRLEGRTREFLLRSDGERISGGITTYLMRHVASVSEFQVYQESLDHIRVLVVPINKLTPSDNNYIQDSFRYYLGDQTVVDVEEVERIPRTAAQKLQIVINQLL